MVDFARILRTWYACHQRDLPWRQTTDPYRIWVSEIILQQTRVEQGMDYYLRFVARFPDIRSLADADEREVLKYWEGLGYYSRARNMHQAAKQIQSLGRFPDTFYEIRKMRGVGDYTAAAIASFAYGLPHAVVDGNVYRVLARYFGVETPIDTTNGKRVFADLAASLLDRDHPAEYNQAIMDFGALQCVPKNPVCDVCPLHDSCVACRNGKLQELPVKKGKQTVRPRFFTFIYILVGREVALWRRGAGDIWEGLCQPLLFEWKDTLPDDSLVYARLSDLLDGSGPFTAKSLQPKVRQRLSHQLLEVSFYLVSLERLSDKTVLPDGVFWVHTDLLSEYAYPKILTEMTGRIHFEVERVKSAT